MSRFMVVVPHHLTYAEAVRRVKLFGLGRVQIFPDKKIDDLPAITGELSLTVMGFPISGDLRVSSSKVGFSGNLSFLASFFINNIEAKIRKRMGTLLT